MSTLIDCQGVSSGMCFSLNVALTSFFVFCWPAFNLDYMYASLQDITVANCVGGNGGGLSGNQIGLYLSQTRWINNTARNGGAMFLYWSDATLTGVNYFINNTASIAAGAVYGNYVTILHLDASDFIASGNDAPKAGNPSNFFLDSVGGIQYTGNKAPQYAVGPNIPAPEYYIDSRVNCARVLCDGSALHPYSSLVNATLKVYFVGGTLNVMPGIYTGPNNIQQTFSDANVVLQQWPNTSGEVIIDCQHQGWGIWLYDLAITITNITLRNCINLNRPDGTEVYGGGALLAQFTRLTLSNVNFINNSARVGSGGALYMTLSELIIEGGSFVNNTAQREGGAVMLQNAVARVSQDALFLGNSINGSVVQDLSCASANVQNDGTVSFTLGQTTNCFVSATSATTTAVFPGSLAGILYPHNVAGDIQQDLFAVLDFVSIVELDSATRAPIETTRLFKQDLEWTLTVTNSSKFIVLEYDAFGPAHQFLAIIHTFFVESGTFTPLGATLQPSDVAAGVIKTSIEVAMWDFQSPANYLVITLEAATSAPIVSFTQQTAGSASSPTEFVLRTADITVTLSALSFAVYDSLTNVGEVAVQANGSTTSVAFQFVFSSFDLWVSYDPQFGVLLGGEEDVSGGADGSTSSAPLGLILGLSLGLSSSALLFVVFVVVIAGTAMHVWRVRKRREIMGRASAADLSD